MNAKQQLHQAKLGKWKSLFLDQSQSGLTVKEWCSQNNVSIHQYNYWKHKAKEAYVESIIPEIVPIIPTPTTTSSIPHCIPESTLESRDSRNSFTNLELGFINLSIGDIRIEFGPSATDEAIFNVLKAVRHA